VLAMSYLAYRLPTQPTGGASTSENAPTKSLDCMAFVPIPCPKTINYHYHSLSGRGGIPCLYREHRSTFDFFRESCLVVRICLPFGE